jgi:hypothetical protein
MNKLVAGVVVVGFGAALVLSGHPVPVTNATVIGQSGFSFQMQTISLPQIKFQLPDIHLGQSNEIVEQPVVAGVKAKPASPVSAVEPTQMQMQQSISAVGSCSGMH